MESASNTNEWEEEEEKTSNDVCKHNQTREKTEEETMKTKE